MKKSHILLLVSILLILTGCVQKVDGDGLVKSFRQISQDEARYMMERDDGHIIIDVRRQDEYDAGHIPGAILIPNESIGTERPKQLADLDQILLVYCRSGNRSKQAAQKLVDMGYTNVYEFGGITTWKWDTITTEQEAAVAKTATLVIKANGSVYYASLAENSSSEAFSDKLSSGEIEVKMHDYGNFEKVGSLPWILPNNDEQITTEPGDIILYQGNQIIIYYGQNTWSFTKLAKIGSVTKEDLLSVFGDGNVTVAFSIEWNE